MANDILVAARREEQRLLTKRIRLERRLSAIRAVIEEYGDQPTKARPTGNGGKTKTGAIIEATTAILREAGGYMTSRQIYHLLVSQGVSVGGHNPVANLAAHLSNAKEYFEADRRHGYRLRDSLKNPKPDAEEPDEDKSPGSSIEGGSRIRRALDLTP